MLKLPEDHDYVRHASQHGAFGVLTSVRIPVSMRRLEKEGFVGLAFKYLWCEMYALAGKPIRSMPFEYEFGAFQSPSLSKGHPLIDVAELRAQLGRFENPIPHLSQTGLEQMRRWIEFDPLDATRERVRLLLEYHDRDSLDDYLQKRLTLIREHRLPKLNLEKLKQLPEESIRLLEPTWLRDLNKTPDQKIAMSDETVRTLTLLAPLTDTRALDGEWRIAFCELGSADDCAYTAPSFDDSAWEQVRLSHLLS